MTDDAQKPHDPDARLHEVQLATLRSLAPVLARMRPLAEQILSADIQLSTMLQILDSERGEP